MPSLTIGVLTVRRIKKRIVGGFDGGECYWCARDEPCGCGSDRDCRCSCGSCMYPGPLPGDGPDA